MRFLGFLRRRGDLAKENTPEHLPRKIFPSGIKLVCGPDGRLIHGPDGKLIGSPDDGTIDIVFIHGLKGDREETWTAKDATDLWPKILLPPIFPAARILTFGYDAYVANGRDVTLKKLIAKHANDLLESLSSSRKEEDGTNERPIIFVCHSLGGLVCEDALYTSRQQSAPHFLDIFHSARGIIFIDPPNHEYGHESWTDTVFSSTGFPRQANSDSTTILKANSEVFTGIEKHFHDMVEANSAGDQPPIKVTYFYEKPLKLGVDLSVRKKSAIPSVHTPMRLDSKHIDMKKFANADDPGFMAVCEELLQWMRDMGAKKRRHANVSPNQSSVASQHGHNTRQYNLIGGDGTQKVIGGNYFKTNGNQNFHFMPPKNAQVQPPPYSNTL
ncbi:hypothetical protein N7522_006255 [Penicillium canescens]|nr:hypothetical protein N7522_006255 [Penicillium canescens]